jgi:hypothetical protein
MDLSEDRTQTELYAHCNSCGAEWQIRSFASPPVDAQGCSFCNAGADAISILSERADFSGGLAR